MLFSIVFTNVYIPVWSVSATRTFCASGLGSAHFGAGFRDPFCLPGRCGLSQHQHGLASFLPILVRVEARVSGT